MELSSSVRLLTLLNDFHAITHIDIHYISAEASGSAAEPLRLSTFDENRESFMAYLQRVPELKEHISVCEAEAIARTNKRQESIGSYEPFPGLTTFILPVFSRGLLLGYVLGGPIRNLNERNLYHHSQRNVLYTSYHLNPDIMSALYNQIPTLDINALWAAYRLFTITIEYSLGTFDTPSLADRIADYIDKHFMTVISHRTTCSHFHISSSTLNRSLTKAFGMTFQHMLNKRRVRHVCKCLQDGMSSAQASAQSGFSSTAYMSRVFSSVMGCTPNVYKQSLYAEKKTLPLPGNPKTL